MTVEVRVRRLQESAQLPVRQSEGAAGYDIYAVEDVLVPAQGRALVHSGIALAIPHGYEGQVRPRSGLALRYGVRAHLGTIDSDYRGELQVLLHNDAAEDYKVQAGDRVAQLVIAPVVAADFVEADLDETRRGEGGFGHTGS
ncbi:MAG: dUTP diphosphatase [Thermaerobacter sp.]|nr:dUTP diphosphatase [Thermaerobacter sp.]